MRRGRCKTSRDGWVRRGECRPSNDGQVRRERLWGNPYMVYQALVLASICKVDHTQHIRCKDKQWPMAQTICGVPGVSTSNDSWSILYVVYPVMV